MFVPYTIIKNPLLLVIIVVLPYNLPCHLCMKGKLIKEWGYSDTINQWQHCQQSLYFTQYVRGCMYILILHTFIASLFLCLNKSTLWPLLPPSALSSIPAPPLPPLETQSAEDETCWPSSSEAIAFNSASL